MMFLRIQSPLSYKNSFVMNKQDPATDKSRGKIPFGFFILPPY